MLLPTLGKPTRATSASSLSSRRSQRSSPTSPCSAKAGARRRLRQEAGVAPAAPAALGGQPAVAGVDEVGQQVAVLVVHHGALGHGHDRGRRPRRRASSCPGRGCRSSARRCGWSRKASSEATLRSATSQTSPPVPPSPPSGPPLGTWASRRNGHTARAAVAGLRTDLRFVDEPGHARRIRAGSSAPGVGSGGSDAGGEVGF